MAATLIGGCGPNSSQRVATMAAPVGVTSSLCTPFEYVGLPCSKFAVAGAGTRQTPRAILAVPPPTFGSEKANFSKPSACDPVQNPTISPTQYTPPTLAKSILSN